MSGSPNEHDLTTSPQTEYWRDHLMKVLGWGTAMGIIIIGWLIPNGDRFEPLWELEKWQKGTAVASLLLMCFLPISQYIFIRYIQWIYATRLQEAVADPTIHPRQFVMNYAVCICIGVDIIAVVVCLT